MTAGSAEYSFYTGSSQPSDFCRAVLDGLGRSPRCIPPKYFYDSVGARLFEEICEQPEYYPTTTELDILRQYAADIAGCLGNDIVLIEPGSGSCEKVRTLLDELRPSVYVPVDISCEQLRDASAGLVDEYGWLEVHAVCADITDDLRLPDTVAEGERAIFYPGSSIGNFEPDDAVGFLGTLADVSGADGRLLIGVDLQKDPDILNAAYNDANGITADFNLNLLHRINRELDANFDVDAFDHHAFYNEYHERIEMHLVSTRKQSVTVAGQSFDFCAGDNIHTENSYKYTPESFANLAARAGFIHERQWTDDDGLFSLQLLRVA